MEILVPMMNFEEMSHQTDAQLIAPDYGVDELGLDMPGASRYTDM